MSYNGKPLRTLCRKGLGFRGFGFRVYGKPSKKLETGLRTKSAGIPYTLLSRIEAFGFLTFGLLQ